MIGEGLVLPPNAHIGLQIRRRRIELGLTQQEVAKQIGVGPQVLQKYERSGRAVPAITLWQLASVLDVPWDYFFYGLGEAWPDPKKRPINKQENELLRNFAQLNPELRNVVLKLLKDLAVAQDEKTSVEPD